MIGWGMDVAQFEREVNTKFLKALSLTEFNTLQELGIQKTYYLIFLKLRLTIKTMNSFEN